MATLIPLSERRSSLDRAHQGDIEGALGRLSMADTAPRRSISRWLATLLAVVGPGIVVMVADNDAGGISTYAEAGRNYGSGLLWCLLLLAGVLFVNQEMVARLGAVTGVGHARLIRERFGRCWGQFALGDLLLLNLLTIITEFIGASLALGYFGVSRFVAVPLTAVVLCAVPATGNYRHWERAMYVFVAGSLVTVPLAALGYLRVHSSPAVPLLGDVRGAGASGFLLLLLALAGTTVAPWQLFFQQSNVVDKRITPRWISYERVDTLLGTALFVAIAAGVFMGCAYAFNGLPPHGGAFLDAGDIAVVLRDRLGPAAGDLFAVALLNGSIIGAAAVSLATSYAVGDALDVKHSLHRTWREAPVFHGAYLLVILSGAVLVLIPNVPLGLVTEAVQALSGILLPSASIFLLLLCNDTAVLGPWVNPRWLNGIAMVIVTGLLTLSGLLLISAIAPGVDLMWVAAGLAIVGTAALTALGVSRSIRRPRRHDRRRGSMSRWERLAWSTPPLERLEAPELGRGRTVALVILRAYLLLAGLALVVEFVRLA